MSGRTHHAPTTDEDLSVVDMGPGRTYAEAPAWTTIEEEVQRLESYSSSMVRYSADHKPSIARSWQTSTSISPGPKPHSPNVPARQPYQFSSAPDSSGLLAAEDATMRAIRHLACDDPQVHSETRIAAHGPDLLESANSRDTGVARTTVKMRLPEESWNSSSLADQWHSKESPEPKMDHTFRRLTGGNLRDELADVPAHVHQGHSIAVKVRPAIGTTAQSTIAHEGHLPRSKVGQITTLRPFQYADQASGTEKQIKMKPPIIEAALPGPMPTPDIQVSSAQSPLESEDDMLFTAKSPPTTTAQPGDLHDASLASRMTVTFPHHGHGTVSKVRMSSHTSSVRQEEQQAHAGHGTVSKVRGFETTGSSNRQEEAKAHVGHSNVSKVRGIQDAGPSETLTDEPNRELNLLHLVEEAVAEPVRHWFKMEHADVPKGQDEGKFKSAAPEAGTLVDAGHELSHAVNTRTEHRGHSTMSKIKTFADDNNHKVLPTHAGHASISKVQPYHGDDDRSGSDDAIVSNKTDWGDDEDKQPGVEEYWGIQGRGDGDRGTSESGTVLRHPPPSGQRPERHADHVRHEQTNEGMEDQDAGRASPRSQAEDERSLMPFSMSAKLDYRRTRQWICDLLKYPDSYTSQLTQRPERARGGQATDDTAGPRDSVLSRVLTRQSTAMSKASTATNTIDNKFRLAVSNLEKLLHEAVDLAEEVADRDDDHRCPEQGGGTIQERSQSPPSIHESLPSMEEQCQLDEQEAGPRHAVLGMHSGNVKQPVPERLSSLPKARAHAGHGLLVISQLDDTPRPPPVSSPRPEDLPNRRAVREFIRVFDQPPIQPRGSSLNLRSEAQKETIGSMDRHSHRTPAESSPKKPARIKIAGKAVARGSADSWSFDGVPGDEVIDWRTQYNLPLIQTVDGNRSSSDQRVPYPTSAASAARDEAPEGGPAERAERARENRRINLRGRAHVSLRGYQGFSLARSHPRQPVARDWSSMRKRFVASVACISTALIGVLIGIYAGLVPSIQYWIADMDHYAILGNVGFYVGLAVPTFFFWPLPLLHGRKPYILSSLVVAMPLLFPQAIAVGTQRSPYVSAWRIALLVSRALMGFSLGFASMNFHSILTDLFGASLMSSKPHQEVVDKFDVRRHGGGMGVWLGIWTWCFTGSIAVGFMIGACIISTLNPSWGFYISIILIAVVLVLNVVCPEVRRSAFRRSVAEVRKGNVISRRVARGEIMMHRVKDGPTWWGPEVYHGMLLSLEMMRQPGFAIMALYTGWIYSQVVLIIVLLGSLTSRAYLLRSPLVGLCVALVAVGALIAVPFQKANIFSRGRQKELTNADTFKERRITWTSHLLRRAVFCIGLPLAGMAYTLVSSGPKIPVEVPTLFAAIVGNLSGLAISECNGLIMETFDTSDLQPGMTGRPRSASAKPSKRTNYSSFPRVTAGFACCHTMGFLLAAVATGVGGIAQRNLGQRAATGVVASILFVLTVLLLAVLIRFKEVRIIPSSKTVEMDKWTEVRIENIRRRSTMAAQAGGAHHGPSGPGARGGNATGAALPHTMTDEEIWRPVIMGNPSNKTRRVNVLELGSMTRWTEIRRKNKLIDQSTSAHLNRAALEDAAAHFNRHAMEDAAAAVELVTGIGARTTDLVRKVSNRGRNRSPGPPPAAGHPPQQQQGRHFYSGSPGGGAKTTTSKTPGTRAIPPLELDLEDVDHPLAADAGASHSDHDDESYGLPAHAQTRGAGHDFSERECVMGQTVVEEEEEEEEVGVETEESDDDELHPGHEHAPTTAAWKGKGKGKGKAVLDDEEWMERDPGSHVTAKVRNADEF